MIIGTEDIIKQINKTSLLFFSTSWCGPCKILKPNLEILKLSNYNEEEIDIIYINLDDIEAEIIDKLNISSIPSLYIYNPNEQLNKNNVLVSSDINDVKKYLQDNNITITEDLKFDDEDF
jgi:thiol-disulfide isomerase/thioredoxin